MNLPQNIRAGDAYSWTESESSYPATTYRLKYKLSGPSQITLTASASGDAHAFTIDSPTSAAWVSGMYDVVRYVEKISDSARTTLESAKVEILADLVAAVGSSDARSTNRIVLDNLRTILKKRSTQGFESMTIGGKSVTSLSWTELVKAFHHFEYLVRQDDKAEAIARGEKAGSLIMVRFERPS